MIKLTRNNLLFQFSHGKKAWFIKQTNDAYVRKAKQQNYRSRASFKLLQIQQKYTVLGKKVLDLGCSPGSWSQIAKIKYPDSKIVGVDLLQVHNRIFKTKPIDGINFYQKDARSKQFHKILQESYGKFDTVISDMAPNFSGDLRQTHEQIVELNQLSIILCLKYGSPKCNLVMKTVQGIYEKNIFSLASSFFKKVQRSKPNSSRSESVQFYYVCKELSEKYANNDKIIEAIEQLNILVDDLKKNELKKILSRFE